MHHDDDHLTFVAFPDVLPKLPEHAFPQVLFPQSVLTIPWADGQVMVLPVAIAS